MIDINTIKEMVLKAPRYEVMRNAQDEEDNTLALIGFRGEFFDCENILPDSRKVAMQTLSFAWTVRAIYRNILLDIYSKSGLDEGAIGPKKMAELKNLDFDVAADVFWITYAVHEVEKIIFDYEEWTQKKLQWFCEQEDRATLR